MRIPHNQFSLGDHIAQLAGAINRCANGFTDAYTQDKDTEWKKEWLTDTIHKMYYMADEIPAMLEVAKKYNIKIDMSYHKPIFKPEDFTRKRL